MADNFNDQELSEIFRKRLPPQPIPADVEARVRQRVLMEVAALRESASSVESATPSSEHNATPTPLPPRVRRPQVAAPQGFWPRLWNHLRERLTVAPSLAFATATAAVLLFVLLYGREFLTDFSDLLQGGNTGRGGIETLAPPEETPDPGEATPSEVAQAQSPTSAAPEETEGEFAATPTSGEPELTDTPVEAGGENGEVAPAGEGGEAEPPVGGGESPQTPATPAPNQPAATGTAVGSVVDSLTPTAVETGTGTGTPTKTPVFTGTPSRTPTANVVNNGVLPTVTPTNGSASTPTATSILPTPTNTPNDGAGTFQPATSTPVLNMTPTRTPRTSRTPTPTETDTVQAPSTSTPSKTPLAVETASTGTSSRTPTPTNTPTQVVIGTPRTLTPTATKVIVLVPTPTPVPPTNTPVPPTPTPVPPTNTPVPPTPVPPTPTPVPPTDTPTNTPVPPTDTPTNTPVPPTDTPTNTPVPPTDTPTNTPVPPTDTPTNTPVPPIDTPMNTPVPNSPPLGEDDHWDTNQDTAISKPISDLLANDSDPEDSPVSFVGIVDGTVQQGSVNFNDDTITFTPAGGFAGEASFQYEISDGLASARATVRITVNRPPVFVTEPVREATTGVGYSYNIGATDEDGNFPLQFGFQGPPWLELTPTGDGTAQLAGTPTGPQDSGEVVLIVRDAAGAAAEQRFSITVAPAPAESQVGSVRPASSLSATLGQALNLTVPIGAGNTATLAQAPDWLRLEPAGDGLVNLVSDQVVGTIGLIEVQLVLTDSAGNQTIVPILLTVIGL